MRFDPTTSSARRAAAVAATVFTLGAGTFAVGSAASSDRDRPASPTATSSTPPEVESPEGGTAPVGASSADVAIVGFAFDPLDVEIPAQSAITWTNNDAVGHNIFTSDGRFASEDLARGDTYSVTVGEPGTIDYYCDIHQYMRGTITVTS